MTSQNLRQECDRQDLTYDYLVNLKPEMEAYNLHQRFDLLIKEQLQTPIVIKHAIKARGKNKSSCKPYK